MALHYGRENGGQLSRREVARMRAQERLSKVAREAKEACQANRTAWQDEVHGLKVDGFMVINGAVEDRYGNFCFPLPADEPEDLSTWIQVELSAWMNSEED